MRRQSQMGPRIEGISQLIDAVDKLGDWQAAPCNLMGL